MTQPHIVFDSTKEPSAFDNDVYALQTVSAILVREQCRDFVETGTFMGGTSLGIQKAFPDLTVWTTESDEQLHRNAADRFKGTPIRSLLGNSVKLLAEQIIPKLRPRPFFYLDSHVSAYNVEKNPQLVEHYPLHSEIELISTIRHLRPIIAIHDFYNPQHPAYSFDRDHGVPLAWDYIKDQIRLVYPDQTPIPHFYNDAATGNRVGIIYIGTSHE